MSLILDGSNGITFPNNSTQAVGFYGFKNRIINGAMVIDQRNAGASISSAGYPVDRFSVTNTGSSTFTASRSTTAPVGFVNSLNYTVGTGASTGATDQVFFRQIIEGVNGADLGWGTANAKTVTVSFWVYSSQTGNFGFTIQNYGATRSYVSSYTISSANTWTQISLTIAGDTTGTWNTDTANGWAALVWDLGVGSTYSTTAGSWNGANYRGLSSGVKIASTSSATFYITGVQLEAGSTATSFDYRPYGTELALCQRYYFNCSLSEAIAFLDGGTAQYPSVGNMTWPVTMRSTPSVAAFTFGAFDYNSGSTLVSFTPTGGSNTYYGSNTAGYVASAGISNGQGASQTAKVGFWNNINFSLSAEL